MMRTNLTLTGALALAMVVAGPSVSQARTFGGNAALLHPAAKSPVQLKELGVKLLLPKETGKWHVQATYTLKSHSAREQNVDLVMNEHHCDSDKQTCRSPTAGHFHELHTTVDGKPITPKMTKGPDGRNWHFTFKMKGKSQVKIEQKYRIERTTDAAGELMHLTMGPSKRWHGPVSKAHIDMALHQRPWMVGYPASFRVSHYGADIPTDGVMKGTATTHLRFRMRRWRPSQALFVHLTTARDVSPAHRCPSLRAVATASKGKQHEAELKRILVMRSLDDLKRCRSLYLALYGFPFSKKLTQRQFYGKPVPSGSALQTTSDGKKEFRRFGLRLNPTYTADLHPKLHQRYLEGLAAEIARRKSK
ncbi:MAG: hypothetical protein KC502_22285 [Myxococcales bacterium]|nr:hypothetical protein [Myxococcales bacterium]